MSGRSSEAAGPGPPVLAVPSPSQIREELEAAVIRDLLGPAGGPEEEVDARVRDRYLVGMLAPRRQVLAPEEFDELAVAAGDGTGEEGATDIGAPQTPTLFPSSFGLTFCVDGTARALRITARWGAYDRVDSAVLKTDAGNPKKVWKRRPIEGTSDPLPIAEGPLRWTPAAEFPDVAVQGLVRRQGADWIITLFLVNAQEEPGSGKDQAWLFQPELVVSAPDGTAVFLKRIHPHDPARVDGEDRALAMIYRRHVEFAVGHGVSVHAEPAPGTRDRAARVATRIIPIAEVPQVTAPTAADVPALGGLVRDMKELVETAPGELAGTLAPLVAAYRQWIAQETARIADPGAGLAEYHDVARQAMQRCGEAATRSTAGPPTRG